MTKKKEKKKKNEAEPMPSLIYKNVTLEDGPEKENPAPITKKQIRSTADVISHYRSQQTKTKSWLWLGVLSLSAIIFFFWGWSLIASVTNVNWAKTQESGLVNQTKQNWNEIFTADDNSLINAVALKTQISTVIEELKKQAEQSTTTLNIATMSTSTSAASTTVK